MKDKMLNKLYVGKIGIPLNGMVLGKRTKVLYHNKRDHYIDIDTGTSYSTLSETSTLSKYGVIPQSLTPFMTYVNSLNKLNREVKVNATRQKKLKLTWRIK